MIKQHFSAFFALFALLSGGLLSATFAADAPVPETATFADLADRALPAEIVAKVRIMDVVELKSDTPPHATNPQIRAYIEAEIEALIKGPEGLPRHVALVADLPTDIHGRALKIKKSAQLIFARNVPERSGFVQLIGPNAMLNWNAERESVVRAILATHAAPDSPPQIKGIDTGFSVAGTVAGERETQIFLSTDSRPVSLSIAHHPGEAAHWSVALGEIADNGAPPPARDTVLWYELACHLPPQYPEAKLKDVAPDAAAAIRADYDMVLHDLGTCVRGL